MLQLSLKVVKYRQAISPSIEVVAASGFAAALFFGVRNGMTLEGFMTLGMALYMSYEPIKKLGSIHSLFRQGDAAIERMEFILHEPDYACRTRSHPSLSVAPQMAIRFENLSFAYDEEPVLRDINVEIPIGKVIALVGPSGAGKSTFASLIPRFYDPQSGAITLDGTDLREFAKKDLRGSHRRGATNAVAVCRHDRGKHPHRPPGCHRCRSRRRRPQGPCRRIHPRILPDGYQTQVGERGDQLSGGQRQRIAIARAFLRNAPILILDEATSALDSESEAMVQQALAELVKGRTTFIIAHRFSTITIADRILVFEAGRIVADGTHDQLRQSSPIYRSMYGLQSSAQPTEVAGRVW